MKNSIKVLAAVSLIAIFTGCWTFDETKFPNVVIANRAELIKQQGVNSPTNFTVAVRGFATVLTEYEAIHGFQTVYVPGHCGYSHHYYPGYFETVPVASFVPQRRSTDMFLRRAVDAFEKAGVVVSDINPDCVIDVAFDGPFIKEGDEWRKLAWNVFTLFFCDYGSVQWHASLRVRDAKTGRLIHHGDFTQHFETHVFGLIPLFGISASRATNGATMQTWCLAALTDMTVADAIKKLL